MSARQRRDLSKQQKQLRAETAERLESIVEAAERAAESVIDDAEAQARRHLAEARAEAGRATADGRLSELAGAIESLLAQAASLGKEAERLQLALEAAREGPGEEEPEPGAQRPQPAPPREAEGPPEPQPPRLRAVGAQEGPAPVLTAARDRAAGARLLATQLAVSGSSREEIAGRLRTGFEIEDSTAILDAILGPEE